MRHYSSSKIADSRRSEPDQHWVPDRLLRSPIDYCAEYFPTEPVARVWGESPSWEWTACLAPSCLRSWWPLFLQVPSGCYSFLFQPQAWMWNSSMEPSDGLASPLRLGEPSMVLARYHRWRSPKARLAWVFWAHPARRRAHLGVQSRRGLHRYLPPVRSPWFLTPHRYSEPLRRWLGPGDRRHYHRRKGSQIDSNPMRSGWPYKYPKCSPNRSQERPKAPG